VPHPVAREFATLRRSSDEARNLLEKSGLR
jgi:hypothetical protein